MFSGARILRSLVAHLHQVVQLIEKLFTGAMNLNQNCTFEHTDHH